MDSSRATRSKQALKRVNKGRERLLNLGLAFVLALSLIPINASIAFGAESTVTNDDEQGTMSDSAVQEDADEVSQTENPTDTQSSNDDTLGNAEASAEAPLEPPAATNSLTETQAGEPSKIVVVTMEPGVIYLSNLWDTNIIISQSGFSDTTVVPDGTINRPVAAWQTIEIKESIAGATFRSWYPTGSRLLALVAGVNSTVTSMPHMSCFTVDEAGTIAGNDFFSGFNAYGSLRSLPAGSFDTSSIVTAGDNFFMNFNHGYLGDTINLTSLPQGSFNTSNITTVGKNFFAGFNSFGGSLTALPTDSFDTSGITRAPYGFFSSFNNYSGALRSLPEGSFDTSNITETGDKFFYCFNGMSGALTSLPQGSFNTSSISQAGEEFFAEFNWAGTIRALPSGSFDLSRMTEASSFFFYAFNQGGAIASFPAGSFDLSRISSVSDYFLWGLNNDGAAYYLPQSFKLPVYLSSVGSKYCENMFSSTGFPRGDQSVALYFAAGASNVFFETNITPVSPSAGATVYVNGCAINGWHNVNGDGSVWQYYYDYKMVKGKWQKIGAYWYYFDNQGTMLSGSFFWSSDIGGDNKYYFLGDAQDGAMKTGWILYPNGWRYHHPTNGGHMINWQWLNGAWYYLNNENDGYMVTGDLIEINKVKYSFANSGAMKTGWVNLSDGNWVCHNSSGAALSGWHYLNGNWYYFAEVPESESLNPGVYMTWGEAKDIIGVVYSFDTSGSMITGWKKLANGSWLYHAPSGAALTGWQYLGGKWYYLASDPSADNLTPGIYMAIGRKSIGETTYLLVSDGHMAKGWILNEEGWRYYHPQGHEATSWQSIAGSWYYLDPSHERGKNIMASGAHYLAPWNDSSPSYSDFDIWGHWLRYSSEQ